MVQLRCFLAVACAVFQLNEASDSNGTGWKVASREEVMATMTPDIAARTVLRMTAMHRNPELMNLISSRFGIGPHRLASHRGHADSHLQVALRGSGNKNDTGYSGLEKARLLLNEMGMEARGTLDESEETCKVYDLLTTRTMERLRLGVATYNADAAGARGKVVLAQGNIATHTTNLIQATEALEQHKKECKRDLDFLNAQIRVVTGDIEVMASVLALTTCEAESGGQQPQMLLVQCAHCNNAIYLQHDKVAQMLGRLKSGIAKQIVQSSLGRSFTESLDGKQPIALAQEYVERLRSHATYAIEQVPTDGRDNDGNTDGTHARRRRTSTYVPGVTPDIPIPVPIPVGGLNTSDVPVTPLAPDCQATTKCTIGSSPNCQRLKDRFLAVQAGIVDQKDELEGEEALKQQMCEELTLMYTQQIDALNENLRMEQANLAMATRDQNIAEKGSHQNSAQHFSVSSEYTRTKQQCCDKQNEATSELCALVKIRGELMKLEGDPAFMADCSVSAWKSEECSQTCGGGTGMQVRVVVVPPEGGGMECPPLRKVLTCNEHACPIDCKVNSWGGWSSCSAQCGGGVKERNRQILREMRHDGEPCAETDDEEACNMQSCSVDCVLSDWSQWSGCSKACDTGSQRRTKSVVTAKRGEGGKCSKPESPERLEFHPCNVQSCGYLITSPRTILNCDSKVDVVIVIDGSASLGQEGWQHSKSLVGNLTSAFSNGTQNAKVAIELFSGPKTWDDYELCTGDANGTSIDMKEQCGIEWVSHFTNNTGDLQSASDAMEWPQSTTLTSVALGQAENELIQGREDANSIVIVITDGVPMSQRNTRAASEKLQEKAKVLWVPVGSKAPIELITELASLPRAEHVINIDSFASLSHVDVINRIVSTTCPVLS